MSGGVQISQGIAVSDSPVIATDETTGIVSVGVDTTVTAARISAYDAAIAARSSNQFIFPVSRFSLTNDGTASCSDGGADTPAAILSFDVSGNPILTQA